MRERLLELCRLNGDSGLEDAVRAYIRTQVLPYADPIEEDPAGNLMAFKRGTSSGKTVMVSAHMDEVGFIVKSIHPDGTLRFAPVGGIVDKILPAMRVTVGEHALPGVISMPPPHMGRDKILKPSDLVVDIGAENREQAEKLTYPGDFIAYAGEPVFFGDGILKAKALDDRLGCAVMLELLREDFPCDIWYAFTVQEEIGSGAMTAAYRLKPDAGLVIECTTAADLPFVKGALRTCSFGGGAAIPTADSGTLYHPALVHTAREAATKAGISWQDKLTIAGGTDAKHISQSGYGVPMVAISAPGRYLHSPVSCVKWSDAEAVCGAVRAFLQSAF